jgi:tRNA dimethylallyltransferase
VAATSDHAPLIAIVGETASGKTALAIEIAEHFGGEIICADSRTVYRGLDIGTAKPSEEERQRVPHHLLDIIDPDQPFSAADFKQLAGAAITDIWSRGKVPLLVGGTGLYIDAVLFDYTFSEPADPLERQRLQALSIEALQSEIEARGIAMPQNSRNARHLMRALETGGTSQRHQSLRKNTLVLGLSIDREALRDKVTRRVDAMVEAGFVQEVQAAAQQYGWDAPGLSAPGYKAFREYLEGNISLEEAKARFVRNDMQLAKRQRTWFKRNKSIHWVQKQAQAVDLATTLLNK